MSLEGKAKSKRCVFRCILKAATEMAEWTDNTKMFQRKGAQERDALAPVLVWALGTVRLIPMLDLSELDGSDGASMSEDKRLLFINGFVGK